VAASDGDWLPTSDGGFVRGRCRIEPIPGPYGGWILEVVPWGRRAVLRSTHAALSAAKAWAAHHERLSVRRANRVRHGFFAVVCAVSWTYLTFLLGPHGTTGRVVVFGTAVILFFLALHELVELLDSVVPDDASDRRSTVAVPADRILETAVLRWSEGASPEPLDGGPSVTILAIGDEDPPG